MPPVRSGSGPRTRRYLKASDPNYEGRMEAALQGMREDTYKSQREAARQENVCRSTLQDRASGKRKQFKKAFTHLQILTPEQEQVVVDWMKKKSSMGLPYNSSDIKSFVYELTGIVVGKKWVPRFEKRHEDEIVSARPLDLDPKRANNFNEPTWRDHIGQLKGVDGKYNGIPFAQVWNMDEKGIQMGGGRNRSNKKFFFDIAAKEKRRLKPDSLELASFLEAVSGAGKSMPLGVVLAEGAEIDTRDIPEGKLGLLAYTPTGWTDNAVGRDWFVKVFVPEAVKQREDPTKPIVLIWDGHESHENDDLEAAAFAAAKAHDCELIIIGLPSKTTHKTQPLDVVILSHVQRQWAEHCATAAVKKRKIDRFNVIQEYIKVRDACVTEDLVRQAFKKTGICPLDETVYSGDDFAPSQASSCQVHLPKSFVADVASSDDMAAFTSNAPYMLSHPRQRTRSFSLESLPPSSESESDSESDPGSESTDSGSKSAPTRYDLFGDRNSELEADPEILPSDREDPPDIDLGLEDHSSNALPNTRSSPFSNFASQPTYPIPVVRTLQQDQMLSEEEKLEELRILRRNCQLYYDTTVHYKGLWQASEAHNMFIKSELSLAREQVANLEAKKSRRGTQKIKARIMVHTEHVEEYNKKEAEREKKRQEALDAEAKALVEKTERERRMKEEVESRDFLAALSSYKLRDDLIVIARILKIDDEGTVKDMRQRIIDFVKDNEDYVAGIPRLSGLVKARRKGKEPVSAETPAPITPDIMTAGPIEAPSNNLIPLPAHPGLTRFEQPYIMYGQNHHFHHSNPYHGHPSHYPFAYDQAGPSTYPSQPGPSYTSF